MNGALFALLAVLGAPMLLLALAGWFCVAAFRKVCAAVAPQPIESEWGAMTVPAPPVPQRRLRPAPCVHPWLLN